MSNYQNENQTDNNKSEILMQKWGENMEQKTYKDTLSSLVEENQTVKQENENLRQVNENLHKAIDISRERGRKKEAGRSLYFTKAYWTTLRALVPHLDSSEKALLFNIMLYLDYETNFVIDAHKNRLNLAGIAKLTGISDRQLMRLLSSLEKKNVIRREKVNNNTYVYVNSIYLDRKRGSHLTKQMSIPAC